MLLVLRFKGQRARRQREAWQREGRGGDRC
jgi:hypothetical protein